VAQPGTDTLSPIVRPQDEFTSLGKRAKPAFLKSLKDMSTRDDIHMLLIDRTNTTARHRYDVFTALGSVGTRVVIEWTTTVQDSIARIESRGAKHRSLGPDQDIHAIVRRTHKERTPLSEKETEDYKIQKRILIPIKLSKFETIKFLLSELKEFLPSPIPSDEEIMASTQQADAREASVTPPAPKKGRNPKPVSEGIWMIHVQEDLSSLFHQISIPGMDPKSEFHVTLFFINKTTVDAVAVGDRQEQAAAVGFYRRARNRRIKLRVKYLAASDRVAAARVEIVGGLVPYFDVIPHISLGKIPGAVFREANGLVERVDQGGTDDIRVVASDREVTGVIKFRPHS
jgi:hypothetical protein